MPGAGDPLLSCPGQEGVCSEIFLRRSPQPDCGDPPLINASRKFIHETWISGAVTGSGEADVVSSVVTVR